MRRGHVRTLLGLLLIASAALGDSSPNVASAAVAPATIWSNPISPFTATGYGFGTYVGGCGGAPKRHTGRDLKAYVGQSIRAAANGKIHGTFFERGVGYTTLVVHSVPYEGTVISRYSHIRPRSGYGAGRIVSRGEVIGTVTNLGSNTHFAFNVYKHSYELWAWRGYLPTKYCGGDPPFPHYFVDPVRYLIVHSDVRAPVTRIGAKATVGSRRPYWTRGSWAVTFSCSDDRAGCMGTQYRLDGGPIKSAPRTLTLSAQGRRTLYYRSYDYHHNFEAWRAPYVLNIDRTLPAAQMQTASSTAFASSDLVQLDATASDPLGGSPAVASGVYAVRFSFCPAERASNAECQVAAGARTSSGWSGRPATELAPGAYEGWAVAEDACINVASSEHVFFTVLVASPAPTESPTPDASPAPDATGSPATI